MTWENYLRERERERVVKYLFNVFFNDSKFFVKFETKVSMLKKYFFMHSLSSISIQIIYKSFEMIMISSYIINSIRFRDILLVTKFHPYNRYSVYPLYQYRPYKPRAVHLKQLSSRSRWINKRFVHLYKIKSQNESKPYSEQFARGWNRRKWETELLVGSVWATWPVAQLVRDRALNEQPAPLRPQNVRGHVWPPM